MSNILVTGGHGMLGSQINFGIKPKKTELDLFDYRALRQFCEDNNISEILHLAARVGGVVANSRYNLDFLVENAIINCNILKIIAERHIEKSTLMLSTCVFPEHMLEYADEQSLNSGDPHKTNLGYGYGKRLLEIGSRCLLSQYGIKSSCLIPCNMYGENDTYDQEYSHVIPALIWRCLVAKVNNIEFVIAGTGKEEREFLYSGDMARLLELIHIEDQNIPQLMIVAPDITHSIEEIAYHISKAMNFNGKIVFSMHHQGANKKRSNNGLFKQYFPDFVFTDIQSGINKTVESFLREWYAKDNR